MECFEALKGIDDFCRVLVKKPPVEIFELGGTDKSLLDKAILEEKIDIPTVNAYAVQDIEEPFIDVFDEEDNLRILVQCRCREQQITFHPAKDGVIVCREECHRKKGESETCSQICRKLPIPTDELQLENMLFIIAKCNNNNTLEALIPKAKKSNVCT